MFYKHNKLDEAELLFQRAFKGYDEIHGSKHTFTLVALTNIARVLKAQNKSNKAEPLFRRALEGLEETLGPNHQYTLNTKGNLGHCLMLQNNPLGREMVVDAFNKLQEGPNGIKASHPWYKKFSNILNQKNKNYDKDNN